MMFDPFTAWSRLMAAGSSMMATNMRVFETLDAANDVIAARTPMINAAAHSPFTADHAELGRMVPEKVAAFSLVGSAMVGAWWEAQSAWMAHMQHLGGMATRGRLPTAFELADLGDRVAMGAVESVEAAARLSSATLAPVHREATANARRLKRSARKRR